jgi:tetratricopeptide (TPR) repeat protein
MKEFDASDETERVAARAAGQDAGAAGLAVMSWALWILGRIDEAVVRIRAALERADAVKHPHTQAYVHYYASVIYALRGEANVAHRHAERSLKLSEEHGFGQWRSLSRAVHAISAAIRDPSSTIDPVSSGLDEYRFGITALLMLFCQTLIARNQLDLAAEIIEKALSTSNVNHERLFEADLYRLKARVLALRQEPNASIDADALLGKALTVVRDQGARSLELRVARDLAKLWRDQGKVSEARELLAPVYGWFTEGFDTRDLKEAKALLEELGS